ncbi:MAG: hypothetical protein ACXVB5_17385, partial [Isosphaeraceae bacterium]
AFEEILALVAADRGARPYENGFGHWTVQGGTASTAVNIFLRRNPQVHKRFRAAFPGFLER